MNLDTISPFRGKSLVGLRFGRLTVLSFAGKVGLREACWNCRCDCSNTSVVSGHNLKRGMTNSCGCLKTEHGRNLAEQAVTHGHARLGKTPTYLQWTRMRSRCFDRTNPYYGGRGITVCDRWKSFENFLADMGERPLGHSIDRINNDGNYEPGNCRWATQKEQCRNQRDNHVLEFQGRRACLAEWAEVCQIPYHTLKQRINNYGWTVDRALTEPVKILCHRV